MNLGIYANWGIVSDTHGFYVPALHAKYLNEFRIRVSKVILMASSTSVNDFERSLNGYEYISYQEVEVIHLPSFNNYIQSIRYFFTLISLFRCFVKVVDCAYVRTPEPFAWLLPVLNHRLKINYHFASNPFEVIQGQKISRIKKILKTICFLPEFYLLTLAARFKSCSANGSSVVKNVPFYLRKRIKVLIESTIDSHSSLINIYRDFKEKKYLMVGRLQDGKGFEDVLSVFSRIKHNDPNVNVQLTIVGDGPLNEKLLNLSRELGISDVVIFKGFVKHGEELDNIYRENNFFINASISETGPRTIIEAMSHGLYCLSSDVGYVRDVLTSDEGFILGSIFPPNNYLLMYDAIYKSVYIECNYKEISSKTSQISSKLTLKNFIESVL
ncbi:glycosyltransferase [Vibrio metschnikovii]|uniref:glycosyltransferase n=1 Tax=Vibrio metschnikovii TaxID=28172 RepID=UPI001C2FAA87|nr:glycosyltransferase [Vibrio metschnikovii]MDA3139742.1 glycosyltransferase family 4 protein [Vibrio metschnikovii]